MLLRGELRDPRLQPASAIGITGVQVSADLSVATVFVDVLSDALAMPSVLAAFRAANGLIRHKLSERLTMRRSPELRFAYDQAIARGARIETILAELGSEPPVEPGSAEPPVADAVATETELPSSDPPNDDG